MNEKLELTKQILKENLEELKGFLQKEKKTTAVKAYIEDVTYRKMVENFLENRMGPLATCSEQELEKELSSIKPLAQDLNLLMQLHLGTFKVMQDNFLSWKDVYQNVKATFEEHLTMLDAQIMEKLQDSKSKTAIYQKHKEIQQYETEVLEWLEDTTYSEQAGCYFYGDHTRKSLHKEAIVVEETSFLARAILLSKQAGKKEISLPDLKTLAEIVQNNLQKEVVYQDEEAYQMPYLEEAVYLSPKLHRIRWNAKKLESASLWEQNPLSKEFGVKLSFKQTEQGMQTFLSWSDATNFEKLEATYGLGTITSKREKASFTEAQGKEFFHLPVETENPCKKKVKC